MLMMDELRRFRSSLSRCSGTKRVKPVVDCCAALVGRRWASRAAAFVSQIAYQSPEFTMIQKYLIPMVHVMNYLYA